MEVNDTRLKIAETYADKVSEFKQQMEARHLTMVGLAIFSRAADPSQRDEVISRHMLLGKFLESVGGKYITHMIAPGPVLNESTDTALYESIDTKTWASTANELGKRLFEQNGVLLAYHPEQGEIRSGLHQRILEETDERYFRLLVDTGHIAAGGLDTPELCVKYSKRLVCVHLKDYKPTASPNKAGNVPLGEGIVDLLKIAEVLRETTFAGYVMSESGGTNVHMRDYMRESLNLSL